VTGWFSVPPWWHSRETGGAGSAMKGTAPVGVERVRVWSSNHKQNSIVD
jgi:hypothetical protein